MKRLLFLVIIMAGCSVNPCPEEFKADLYASGFCIKTNNIPIDTGRIEKVLSYLEEATVETFSDKWFDLRAMSTAQPILLAYWGSVSIDGRHARGFTVRPKRHPEKQEWLVKYPEIHVRIDHCPNLYYVTGHEILHLVAWHHLGSTNEENASHMPERMFFNWLQENAGEREDVVEGKFFENILDVCDIQIDESTNNQNKLIVGEKSWDVVGETDSSGYKSYDVSSDLAPIE